VSIKRKSLEANGTGVYTHYTQSELLRYTVSVSGRGLEPSIFVHHHAWRFVLFKLNTPRS
jgi:hypothetical protein